jgi:hypothetical protein
MRRFLGFAALLFVASACSVPKAETLNCGDDQSIFACQAKFSDGKSRSIVFVKVPAPGQTVLDEITTRDDLGNEYCVTLYQNVTATYHPGTCGSPISGAGDWRALLALQWLRAMPLTQMEAPESWSLYKRFPRISRNWIRILILTIRASCIA